MHTMPVSRNKPYPVPLEQSDKPAKSLSFHLLCVYQSCPLMIDYETSSHLLLCPGSVQGKLEKWVQVDTFRLLKSTAVSKRHWALTQWKFWHVTLLHYCQSTLIARQIKGRRVLKCKHNTLISEQKLKTISWKDFSNLDEQSSKRKAKTNINIQDSNQAQRKTNPAKNNSNKKKTHESVHKNSHKGKERKKIKLKDSLEPKFHIRSHAPGHGFDNSWQHLAFSARKNTSLLSKSKIKT